MFRKFVEWLKSFWGPPEMFGRPRSSQWAKVRATFLKKHGNRCAVCGTKEDIEAHHNAPYWQAPELELEESNLTALCRPHHFLFGHLCDWTAWNPNILDDVPTWQWRITNRPKP